MTEAHFSDYKKYFNDYEWNLEIREKETWDKLNTTLKNYEVFGFDVLKHPEIKSLELVKNFTFINKPIGNEKKLTYFK
ncbi:MAG: hypothetical protein HON61_05200 [Alphaproteobacteria bacterium]|jgi:hypothetical protein|nr:hypothetical protein [Alphaproteobacteria bacterium]